MDNCYYTVYVDNELWVNSIDDMYSTERWAVNGILFVSLDQVTAFVNNLRRYDDWKDSVIDICVVTVHHMQRA